MTKRLRGIRTSTTLVIHRSDQLVFVTVISAPNIGAQSAPTATLPMRSLPTRPKMEIDSFTPMVGVDTSHGQGTLYIITGKYEKYQDVTHKFLSERFASKVPTLFEYLRKSYEIAEHETLIVNGEDRSNEEFYTF